MKDFMHKATVGGQYGFTVLSVIFALPALMFWALQAFTAGMADKLARKRYGIKEEGPTFYTMLSRDIVRSVINIKNPVLASHQEFAPIREEEALPEGGEESDERDLRTVDESEMDHLTGDVEEPSERSLTS